MVAAGLLIGSLARLGAQPAGAARVAIDADDIGGVVTSAAGPEAGVWVIAETTGLPTKFARIVVTDDHCVSVIGRRSHRRSCRTMCDGRAGEEGWRRPGCIGCATRSVRTWRCGGGPARAIQDLAGHQDLATTQRDMHLSPAAIESAIRLLDGPRTHAGRRDMVATGSTEICNVSR